MSAEEVKLELTQDWLSKAQDDLFAAERIALPPSIPNIVTFHCQQAVEKALKGFLTWHDQVFGKTHELPRLVEQCEKVDRAFMTSSCSPRTKAHCRLPLFPPDLLHELVAHPQAELPKLQ